MVNSNANAISIIFPNSYDSMVPELVNERLMASIPFAGRYRMVDFILSSMANCGIDNISMIVRQNYHSLMDHLGSGREWDLVRKNGGLNIFPPFSEKNVKVYNGRVEALASILPFLKSQREKYVIMSDADIAVNFDFNDLIREHEESGADVTVAYREETIEKPISDDEKPHQDFYYTLSIQDGRVSKIYINPTNPGVHNFSMNIYIMSREHLIDMINTAFMRGLVYFERDILAPNVDRIHIHAYRFDGYAARIHSMASYYAENMKLLNEENLNALFSPNPIYTKIRDDNPTRYINGSRVKNIMAADGCVIEGQVENSILFKGVKIGKGAKVKNSILMQDTVIEPGADVDYVITDKNVVISEYQSLKGADGFPVYVSKRKRV